MRRCRARRLAAGLVGLVVLAGCGSPRVGVPKDDPGYLFLLGRAEFERNHYLEAAQHLKRFLDLYPGAARADSAQYLIAQSRYGAKSYPEAAVEFNITTRDYPRSSLRDAAAYHECACYSRQMHSAERDPTFALRARACLNEFLLRYPDTTYREEAGRGLQEIADRLAEKEYRAGVLFARMKRPGAARVYLEGLIEQYPTSRWVASALYWIGRSYEAEDAHTSAVESYRRLLEAFPHDEASDKARKRLQSLQERFPELGSAVESSAVHDP